MVALLLFGVAAAAIYAYSEGQKSGVDAAPRPAPPPPPPIPQVKEVAKPKPGTVPPPTTAANILERKRLIVSRGYQAGVVARVGYLATKSKIETPAASKTYVAQVFTAHKIPLSTPDPSQAFWKQSEQKIADQVATAVNVVASGRFA